MLRHYSQPKGFVGRNICFAVFYDGVRYGSTVAGSATLHLPGRADFFAGQVPPLNQIVNNTFFHVEPGQDGYPVRNFVTAVIKTWREYTEMEWAAKYGESALGFETLVEPPRTGESYRRDGWIQTGVTIDYTAKRVAGQGTDAWTGRRVWNTDPTKLRPKLVFMRRA